MDGQDGLPAWHRFISSMQEVLGIQKHPHYPETRLYFLQNAASVAMVQADRSKRAKIDPFPKGPVTGFSPVLRLEPNLRSVSLLYLGAPMTQW